jgi:hypothetical protein
MQTFQSLLCKPFNRGKRGCTRYVWEKVEANVRRRPAGEGAQNFHTNSRESQSAEISRDLAVVVQLKQKWARFEFGLGIVSHSRV